MSKVVKYIGGYPDTTPRFGSDTRGVVTSQSSSDTVSKSSNYELPSSRVNKSTYSWKPLIYQTINFDISDSLNSAFSEAHDADSSDAPFDFDIESDYFSFFEAPKSIPEPPPETIDFDSAYISSLIRDDESKDGTITHYDRYLDTLMGIDPEATMYSLSKLFWKSYSDPTLISCILKSLSRYTLDEVEPLGPIMAVAAMNYCKDPQIGHAAILAFDVWQDYTVVEKLEAIEIANPRLRSYMEEVLDDLRTLRNSEAS